MSDPLEHVHPPSPLLLELKDKVRRQERRERIALACLQSILASEDSFAYIHAEDDPDTPWELQRARAAVEHADALIQALEQP